MVKKTISTKVSETLKAQIEQKVKETGITISEYLASLLVADFENDKEKEKLQQEIDNLKKEAEAKDKLIERATINLEREQNLLSQQQELQLMAQQQIKEMQKNQQLLIETVEKPRKKWRFWSRERER